MEANSHVSQVAYLTRIPWGKVRSLSQFRKTRKTDQHNIKMASLSNQEQTMARIDPVEESAIQAASALNDLAYGICGSVCFLGDCDKQIQFEVNEAVADYNVINLFQRMANDPAAQASRRTLFDEESVVSGVDSRC
jgi:hypothetical protein